MHEGVGELQLAVGAHVRVVQPFQGLGQLFGVGQLVEAHHGEVRLRDFGLLDHLAHPAAGPDFDDAEAGGVLHLLHGQHRTGRGHQGGQVHVHDGVAEQHEHAVGLVAEFLAGQPQRVADALAGLLHHEGGVQVGVGAAHVAHDFIAQVAHDEHEFGEAGRREPVDEVAQDGVAGHRHQAFGLGVGVRAQARANAGHGNYGFHGW